MRNEMSGYVVIAIKMTWCDLWKWKHCYLDCKTSVFYKARVRGIRNTMNYDSVRNYFI